MSGVAGVAGVVGGGIVILGRRGGQVAGRAREGRGRKGAVEGDERVLRRCAVGRRRYRVGVVWGHNGSTTRHDA
jgi:hypothetical protein